MAFKYLINYFLWYIIGQGKDISVFSTEAKAKIGSRYRFIIF